MNKQAFEIQPPPLPALDMSGAVDGVLDVSNSDLKPAVTSNPWAQPRLWLEAAGIDNSGQNHTITLYESQTATPEQLAHGFNTPIPREELLNFANKSTFHIKGKIAFDGNADETSTELFPPLELTIINQKEKLYELVDFDDQTYGGWTKGPGGVELQFVLDAPGDYALFNNTSDVGGQHKGIVLQKTFPTTVGEIYEVSVDVKKVNAGTPHAMLFFSIDNDNSPINTISKLTWTNLKFSATAASNTMVVALNNDQSSTNGNDFTINNLLVKSAL